MKVRRSLICFLLEEIFRIILRYTAELTAFGRTQRRVNSGYVDLSSNIDITWNVPGTLRPTETPNLTSLIFHSPQEDHYTK